MKHPNRPSAHASETNKASKFYKQANKQPSIRTELTEQANGQMTSIATAFDPRLPTSSRFETCMKVHARFVNQFQRHGESRQATSK